MRLMNNKKNEHLCRDPSLGLDIRDAAEWWRRGAKAAMPASACASCVKFERERCRIHRMCIAQPTNTASHAETQCIQVLVDREWKPHREQENSLVI